MVLPGQEPADGFAHHLLIRRSTRKKQLAGGRVDFEYAYFLVHHRRDAALPEAVCRAGVCWKIEENNEQAKQIKYTNDALLSIPLPVPHPGSQGVSLS
ncbi:hypothetical protein ACQEVY_03875 [Streptomyces sp. CA-288835]|uniref:hypothetical protein n=1 Tax=Streptomyces sp. CA-288835 TaxID=3240069 RepID=UPI003D94D482